MRNEHKIKTMKKITILSTLFLVVSLNIVKAQVNNGNYPKMIKVDGGSFIMGTVGERGNLNEMPGHEVILNTYYISETPVTVAQYRTFCRATGRPMPEAPSWGWQDNHPIVHVNWFDAVAYTDWMAETKDANYRLPTEAEWEYAAKGGKNGKDIKYDGSRSLDLYGWYGENSGGKTHSVGTKKPNELGIYDMIGNVWEWCTDWYDDDYYSISPKNNPKGPASGSDRVMRGGSWDPPEYQSNVKYRNYENPDDRLDDFGFRVVRSE